MWDMFGQMQCTMHFKDLKYVGTQTRHPPTDFTYFREIMSQQLADKSRRAARKPGVVFQTLRVWAMSNQITMLCVYFRLSILLKG